MMRCLKYLLPLLCFAACKRDPLLVAAPGVVDYGQGTGRCRLSVVTETPLADTSKHYRAELHYDDHGRLQWVLNVYCMNLMGGGSSAFEYRGDTIESSHMYGSGDDMVVFNDAGKPGWATIISAYSGDKVLVSFYYDNLGRVAEWRQQYATEYDRIFTWSGNDLLADSTPVGMANNYEYYADRPGQYANPLTLNDYAYYGTPLWKFGHLPKSRKYLAYQGGGFVWLKDSYTYSFDADNKVMADTVRPGSGPGYYNTFSYECN